MKKHFLGIIASTLLLCLAYGGCSPSSPGSSGSSSGSGSGSGPSNGSMTARIDGALWTASSVGVIPLTGTAGLIPMVTISGGGTVSGDPITKATALAFSINNPGVGTFQLVAGGGTGAGTMDLTVSQALSLFIWQASPVNPGSSGTVTFSAFGSGRAAGTFSATVVPIQGGASGNRSVTNGAFDVRF